MTNKEPLNFILWNATTVKNKIAELQNFLDKHNTNIAIVTETWLIPTDKIKIRHYNIERRTPSASKKSRGDVLIAIHKGIPVEDTPQHISTNIDIIKVKLKIAPPHIGAAYAPRRTKITPINLHRIISPHKTGHFII